MTDQNSTLTKTCTGCKAELPANLETFPPHRLGKYGLHPRCRPCKKQADAADRSKPDQKARQKAWRDSNKEKVRRTNKAYREAGYSSTRAVAEWREKNIDRARAQSASNQRRYRREKPWFSLKSRVSSQIRSQLVRFSKGAKRKVGQRTEQLLGYSLSELQAHLESKFTQGMSWEHFLAGRIHIDHVVPVSLLRPDCVNSEAFRVCWALENLQPLWAEDNIKKGAKYDPANVADRLPRLVDAVARRSQHRSAADIS